jgi:formylglycine-generating enzyme required for sulfatase activity
MGRVGRLSLMVAAAACSSVSAACGARSWLELSWDEDAASADVSSVPTSAQDGAMTGDVSTRIETPPSCQAGGEGLTNCGADSESCCASLEVPGGTFYRSYTNDGSGPTDEADPATVSSFRLDKYLVTVGRFRQFVAACSGGWLPSAGSGKHIHLNHGNGLNANGGGYEPGWVTADRSNLAPTNANLDCESESPTWTNTSRTQETLPINCVNWWEAYAFCIWDGGFLPSEAEWEYAAAGGSEERNYPWGSTDPGKANQFAIYNCDYWGGVGLSCPGVTNIAPVGTATLGAGRWGQLDMAGEMWEWNLDWYADYAEFCTDCANFTNTVGTRVSRGAAFDDLGGYLAPQYRSSYNPISRGGNIGFRCARTLRSE